MAFDYTTANTGVFTRIGKLIKYINSRLSLATTTYPAELKAIADQYEAADMTDQIAGLYATYEGFQQAITSERLTLAGYVTSTLSDRTTVLDQLSVLSPDMQQVLPALSRQMTIDSKTIDRSTVTVGSITAGGSNVGNGTILLTKVLDGYNSPVAHGFPMIEHNGLNSELAVTETMTFRCVADSARDGLPEGAEQFSWQGGIDEGTFGFRTEGSGSGPGLTAGGSRGIVVNGDFEDFTDDVPDGWTLVNGTAATHCTSSTATVYRGTTSLKLIGDGALANITLTQAISPSVFQSRRMYCVSIRAKTAGSPAAGNLDVYFTGTGYTAASSEKVNQAVSGIGGSWVLYSFFISMPSVIPDDWKIQVQVSGTLDNAAEVYLDDLIVNEVQYHGGIGAAVIPGSTRFVVGDYFTSAISNNGNGTFQEFFRRAYGVQLPSSGSPNIADSLAE